MKEDSDLINPISFIDESKHLIEFIVPGRPIPKERPRIVSHGGFTRAYTPKKTIDFQNRVKQSYLQASNGFKLEGPVRAEIRGVFEVPKSISKKKRKQMIGERYPHTHKPDCDNISKSILDALNSVAYDDDSHVCELHTTKYYGEVAQTIVILEEL